LIVDHVAVSAADPLGLFDDAVEAFGAGIGGSSNLSMVRASSVESPTVGGKHYSQPIMIKVLESVS
jgi:hypothetical protein